MPYKPDTLIVLTPGFPENEADTTCLPLQQSLVKAMQQTDPDLQIIVLSFQYPFKKQSYTWNGIQVQAFGGRGKGKGYRLYTWIKVWQVLKQLRANNEVKGILSFWLGECAFIGQQFSRRYHIKHHCWILGQDAKAGNHYVRMIRPKGETLIALSDDVAERISANYAIKPGHVIPGGVDPALFMSVVSERTIDILAAGSLKSLKQYHLFIEVVCRLKRKFPNIKAVLCGDGPEKDSLHLMIKKLNMQNHITLTGNIPHQQVLQLMLQSNVFLHPSNYEGLGMVCLEALHAGARVVSFVKGINKPIQNWYKVDSTLAMAQTITEILNDPAVKYTSVTPYKIADIAAQMLQLFINKQATTLRNCLAIASKESVVL